MRTIAILLAVTLGVGTASHPALAQSPAEQGRAIAEQQCARCHAIGREGESPMHQAPPFRDIVKRYPAEQLGEALAEGIVTGHPAMPEFTFRPAEIDALIAYLKTFGEAPQ